MFGSKMSMVEKAIGKNNAGSLITLSGNKDREVSLAAIAGLGSVGGHEAANYLTSRLQSEDADVRITAARALGIIGDIHTKAFVSAQMNKETDPKVKEAMREAMMQIKEY